ncbi:hypothetical protein FISHEDRAFT_77685 [Fistulina hepatica ATCC 64428]|uniref:Uncharacterized protein n=1 Tax=Fistulina hepatica ATCC 64428 TaxID=1128425 RepID=A0A0D7A337_9AGAR|nr:hypothetical protein FISHEDRAFT_77685 [Fistulina hepatica ATCC 64428]
MIYNNYQQALDIIVTDSAAVSKAAATLNVDPNNFELWEKEQAEYFALSGKEPEEIVLAISYVELLQDLRVIELSYTSASMHFMTIIPVNFARPSQHTNNTYAQELSRTHKAETARCIALERHEQILYKVIEMEVKMEINSAVIAMPSTIYSAWLSNASLSFNI